MARSFDLRKFGVDLREFRQKEKQSLRQVEETTGIGYNVISKLERGQSDISGSFLVILADWADLDVQSYINYSATRVKKKRGPQKQLALF